MENLNEDPQPSDATQNLQELPYSFPIGKSGDTLGSLFFTEPNFPVSLVYFIKDVKVGEIRGNHAHKKLYQVLICAAGSFKLVLTNSKQNFTFECNQSETAIFIPPGYWRVLSEFSKDGVCLVLASEKFDESDYIRDWASYLNWLGISK
jgi:oxalate decarboxylase/phosphoglucose isomerase-like protein (cupin superfamily)